MKITSTDYKLELKIRKTITANLKYLRKQNSFLQVDLVKKSGVSRASISCIERGGRVPSLITLIKIANAFDIPVDKLYSYIQKTGKYVKIANNN